MPSRIEWDPETYDPNVVLGSPVSEDAIVAWESRFGVAMPPLLRDAYLRHNGGYVLGRDTVLFPLGEIEPLDEENGAGLADDPRLLSGALIWFGYDEQGGLLLHYETPAPRVLRFWIDGMTSEEAAASLEALFTEGD